jgi:uncharacterized coiled-coil protein SlyX
MKNYHLSIIVPLLLVVLSACNQAELAKSNQDKDSLIAVLNERDASINDFVTSFNDVERNLDSVAVRQHIINVTSDKPNELKGAQRSHINSEIEAINNLMSQNRKKIAEINHRVKSSANKNRQLEKMIATLNDQLTQKNTELADLNAKLNALNAEVTLLQTSVDTLNARNGMQSQTIADETKALHTAYYIIGKSKELQNAKIIDRQGGLLGIGKTAKLTGDFDNSKFTQIDYTQTSSIAVNSDMKIITSHPSNSYTLDKSDKDKDLVNNIVITNPEKFWSASKYLVIVKD